MSPTLAGCSTTILPEGLYLLEERGKTVNQKCTTKKKRKTKRYIITEREGKHITFRIRDIKFFFKAKR